MIYRFGGKSRVAEDNELPRGSGGMLPRKFFEMTLHRWDAIWCILRHNFEKCYGACTDLVVSGWFSDIATYML